MENIYVVTDSTADIHKELVEALDIKVVPLKVHFQNETYLDGETITAESFYQKLNESEELPTTSQPSPIDFVDTYAELDGGNNAKILSIHISSALSGTYQSAALAKSMVEEKGINVTVIDSKKASYAIGIIVVSVAKAIQNGASFEEAVQLTHELIERTQVYFLVDTLTYLQKGGRIGRASSLIGSLLNIKPILSLNEEGEVYPVDKVRGRNKAFARALELLNEHVKGKSVIVGISHAADIETAKSFEQKLKETFDIQDFVLTEIGPVVGTHVGPGTIAIMMHTVK